MKKILVLLFGVFFLSGCGEKYEYQEFTKNTCEKRILKDMQTKTDEEIEIEYSASIENIIQECGTKEEMQTAVDKKREEERVANELAKKKIKESIERNKKSEKAQLNIDRAVELGNAGVTISSFSEIENLSDEEYDKLLSDAKAKKEEQEKAYFNTKEGKRCQGAFSDPSYPTMDFCKKEIEKGTGIGGSIVAVIIERGVYFDRNVSNYGSGNNYQYCWGYQYSPACYYTEDPKWTTITSYN